MLGFEPETVHLWSFPKRDSLQVAFVLTVPWEIFVHLSQILQMKEKNPHTK